MGGRGLEQTMFKISSTNRKPEATRMPRFSKKARRHAYQSKVRTKRMLKGAASRSGPVKVSWLPGFEPRASKTRFPFEATINGRRAIVWPDRFEYPPTERSK